MQAGLLHTPSFLLHTGLANARVTIFGDVYQLPHDLQEAAREIFLQKLARVPATPLPWRCNTLDDSHLYPVSRDTKPPALALQHPGCLPPALCVT